MKLNNTNPKYDFFYENSFHYCAEKSRFEKILNHYELIKKTKRIRGAIVELGVFKGTSLIRFAHFRDILKIKKDIYGFDTFDKFPNNKSKNFYDKKFPKSFSKIAGDPIKMINLSKILIKKKLKNVNLIKGNIFETLEIFKKKKIKISLLHLDLDTEEITKYAFIKLFPMINKGGIIILDDYKIHKGIDNAIKKIKLNKLKILKPIYGNNPHYIIKN